MPEFFISAFLSCWVSSGALGQHSGAMESKGPVLACYPWRAIKINPQRAGAVALPGLGRFFLWPVLYRLKTDTGVLFGNGYSYNGPCFVACVSVFYSRSLCTYSQRGRGRLLHL